MKQLLKFSIVLMILMACKRDHTEFLGPAYIAAPNGFSVTSFTATPTTIDFTSASTDSVVFNAIFTNTVTWKLTIKGQTSGATRTYTGISGGLSNLIWYGSHDGIAFFRAGETAVATLSFFGTNYTNSVSINIQKQANFTKCGTFPNYGDFEIPGNIVNANGWYPFNQSENAVDSMAIDYNGNKVPPIQGKCYYYIRGLGNQPVFVNGIQYTGILSPSIPNTPDNVWVNMYIYGTGDDNTSVDLEYQEEDFNGSSLGYTGLDDDAFVAHITVNHVGWKLFSFKYSSLIPSANANFGGSGNKLHEPGNIKSFDLVLLKKTNPDKPVEVYFDYPIITVGGPFKPCK